MPVIGIVQVGHWLDDAIAEYREALRIQPDLHLAMSHLADALLEKRALGLLGRPNEALPHFEAVVRARPRLVQARVEAEGAAVGPR